jgi:aminoglycoside phosphotransferase (APT) family kinase protein
MTAMIEEGRAERVSRAVATAMPALGRVHSVHRVEAGWGNENWTAETNLGRVMVKIGLADSSPEKWRSAGVALGLARAAGVPAPELMAFDASNGMLDGRVLRVFSYIEGVSPDTLDDQPAKRSRFFTQLGEAVARLHRITQPEFTSRIGGDHGYSRWSDFVTDRWSSIIERATRAGLDHALVVAAEAALFPLATGFDAVAHPVVCHRDLYFDNLLCDADGNLVALLDFDMAEAWEPAADFHKLRWWVFGSDTAAERDFLSGYRAGEPFPEDFEDRVRVVEILDLVNGLANWIVTDQTAMTINAEDRLRMLVQARR